MYVVQEGTGATMTYTWDFNRNSVSKIGITDSEEEAKKLIDSGRGFKILFPNPESEEEKSAGIYLLFSEDCSK